MNTELKAVTSQSENRPESAFALAIAVLRERVSVLSIDDRHDLYELVPALMSDDEEERASALAAANEILDQCPARVVPMALPDEPGDELKNWTEWVSRRIRTQREKAGLTQAELAEKSGLQQPHISKLENGQHSPTALTLERIAKALGVSVSAFDPNQSSHEGDPAAHS